MPDQYQRYTVAAVQAASVFMDREATIDKACHLIDEAGKRGSRIIVFPETWIPTYPFWLTHESEAWMALHSNAIEVPSEHVDRLAQAARRANAYVAMGINERDTSTLGTLYNSLLYLGPDGAVLGVHRKLMPTAGERLVWGMGDGSGMHLFDTPLGRLGGLICWEHEMTLAKYAMYARGEHVHASVWPAWNSQREHIAFGTRQYAFEGRCFVIVACGLVHGSAIPEKWRRPGLDHTRLIADGGSAIIGPNGDYLAGPLYEDEDILYADIHLSRIVAAKQSLDIGGHYSRPDVLRLQFDASAHASLVQSMSPEPDATPRTEPLQVPARAD